MKKLNFLILTLIYGVFLHAHNNAVINNETTFSDFSSFEVVSITGLSVGNQDINLQTDDGINYFVQDVILNRGSFYVESGDDYWGFENENSSIESGILVINGWYEIELLNSGKYNFLFNIKTGEYNFKFIEPLPDQIYLYRSNQVGVSINEKMSSPDRINYNIENILIEPGEFKFYNEDKDELYISNSLVPATNGTASKNGVSPIQIEIRGYYDVSFNIETGEFNFSLLKTQFDNFSFKSADYEILFKTNDGVNYYIENTELNKALYQIRNTDNGSEYYAYANGFPEGYAFNGYGTSYEHFSIWIHAKYNINFNNQTKKYSFEISAPPLEQNEITFDFKDFPNLSKSMNTSDGGINYNIENQLLLSDCTVRFKDNLIYTYGSSAFPNGKVEQFGNNIVIPKAGYYNVYFNFFTREYSFEYKSLYIEKISLIDAGSQQLIQELKSDDAENFSIDKVYLADQKKYVITRDNYGKIEYFDLYDKKWKNYQIGIFSFINYSDSPRYYEIKLDLKNKVFTKKDIATYITNYVLVMNNEEVQLNSTDGINYSLTNYPIKLNSIIYFKNNEQTHNNLFGLPSFPSGTSKLDQTSDKIYMGGNYDISYNILTKAYKFTFIGQPIFEEITLWNSTLNKSYNLKTSNGIGYELTENIEPGLYYFKIKSKPNMLLGGSEFPTGNAKQSDIGISIPYNTSTINFNLRNITYKFIATNFKTHKDEYCYMHFNGAIYGISSLNSNKNIYIFKPHPEFYLDSAFSPGFEYRPLNNLYFDIEEKRYFAESTLSGNLKEVNDINRAGIAFGYKDFTFVVDLEQKTYKFYSYDNFPSLPIYLSNKSDLNIDDVLMYSKDGITYKVENFKLKVGNYYVYNKNDYSLSSPEINITENGTYEITYNINTNKLEYKLIDDYTEKYFAYGTSLKLGEIVALQTTDNVNHSFKNVFLNKGNFVLSSDNDFFEVDHWISTQFPLGKLNHKLSFNPSELIQIPESGYYDFTYNKTTKEFKFTLVSKAMFEKIQLTGSALNGDTLYLETSDGINYQKNSVYLESGDLIVEELSNSLGKSISSKQNSVENVSFSQTIKVENSGYYDIKFDNETLKIELIEKSLATISFENNDDFIAYPNPVTNGILYFNQSANITLYDMAGRQLIIKNNSNELDVSGLSSGTYLLLTDFGKKIKVVIP